MIVGLLCRVRALARTKYFSLGFLVQCFTFFAMLLPFRPNFPETLDFFYFHHLLWPLTLHFFFPKQRSNSSLTILFRNGGKYQAPFLPFAPSEESLVFPSPRTHVVEEEEEVERRPGSLSPAVASLVKVRPETASGGTRPEVLAPAAASPTPLALLSLPRLTLLPPTLSFSHLLQLPRHARFTPTLP